MESTTDARALDPTSEGAEAIAAIAAVTLQLVRRPPLPRFGRTGRGSKLAAACALLLSGLPSGAPFAQGPVLTDPGRLDLVEARDASADGLAFVRVEADETRPFVHQPVLLRVRFGLERGFQQERLIQLFHRSLDVPVQLRAPWLTAVAEPPGPDVGRTVAVGNQVLGVRPLPPETDDAGRTFNVFELELPRVFETPGPIELEAPRLRFAYAEGFRDDLIHGRTPEGRADAFVAGEPLRIDVRALPEDGRPPEFSGAVGVFELVASVEPRSVQLGEGLRLRLRVRGTGSLEDAREPSFPRSRDFELQGVLAETVGAERLFLFDLLPTRAGSLEVPALEWSVFDPSEPAGYRTLRTEPVAIVVRASPDATGTVRAPAQASPAATETPTTPLLWIAVPITLVLGALLLRRGRGRTPDLRRRIAAARVAREQLARPDADAAEVLLGFLADVLECSHPAVVGPELAARLESAGLAPDHAERAARLLDELSAHRYGGPRPEGGERSTRALLDAIASDRA